jgi:hypothetical protein
MHDLRTLRVRILATAGALVMATMLAACAGNPAMPPPPASGSAPTTGIGGGGRLELTVSDQNGAPLDQAEVTVLSISGASFRVRGRTNRAGAASFTRVPAQVRVQVIYQGIRQVQEGVQIRSENLRGNGEEQVEVAAGGTTPLRMTIEVVAQ